MKSMGEEIKLTKAEKREILILREFGIVTTEGYGHRHNLYLRMAAKGIVIDGGSRYRNMFTLSGAGRLIVVKSDKTTQP